MADFEWMSAPARPARAKATQAMREDEILRRASALAHLGFPQDRAEARLRAWITWEYETVGTAAVLRRLPAVVADAFRRAGLAKPSKKKR